MSRFLALFAALILTIQGGFGATMGIPEPKVMLAKSDVVGVAVLRKDSYQWKVKFSKVLKGNVVPGVWIPLTKPLSLDLDMFGKMIGQEPFLFLCFDRQANRHLMPSFWMVSAWPQGKPRDSRLETLEGCIAFAEAVLAAQPPAGENTMPEHAVLTPLLSENQMKELRAEEEAEAARKFGFVPSAPPAKVMNEVKNNPHMDLKDAGEEPVITKVEPCAGPVRWWTNVRIGVVSAVLLVVGGGCYLVMKRRRG